MTAEVVILNRGAVAIAADSAVTVGVPGRKIYNTANKLFPLSATEPVAVMVYGAGSFGSIPWETVIKEHRRRLDTTSHDTVEEYATAFIADLNSFVEYLPKEEQREQVLMTALWELDMVRTSTEDVIEAASSEEISLSEGQIRGLILDKINTRISLLQPGIVVEGLTAGAVGREISAAVGDWSEFVDRSLDGLPTNTEIKRRARVMVRTSLRVAQQFPWSSGVVVAGYGSGQLFPAVSHYVVDGVVADCVRSGRVGGVCIGKDQSAGIYPFAQKEMVATFMDGIHPGYRVAFEEFVDETMGLLIQHFGEQIQSSLAETDYLELLEEMNKAKTSIVHEFQDGLDEFLRVHNSDPIMSIVEILPKEELADMAEALVNLTSFKRRVTPDAETVGGPIDVAVISKGDGLVWIKRKHYFEPELNPRYFGRDQGLRNAGIMGGKP